LNGDVASISRAISLSAAPAALRTSPVGPHEPLALEGNAAGRYGGPPKLPAANNRHSEAAWQRQKEEPEEEHEEHGGAVGS